MTHTENKDLKEKVKKEGLYMWQIADKLGVSEPTLVRWMRYPLSKEKRNAFNDAIKHLKKEGK